MLREGLLVQGSCGTVSSALLAASGSLPVVFNRVPVLSSFRMRHLPVVLCSLLAAILMEGGCKRPVHQVVVGCVPPSPFVFKGPRG